MNILNNFAILRLVDLLGFGKQSAELIVNGDEKHALMNYSTKPAIF